MLLSHLHTLDVIRQRSPLEVKMRAKFIHTNAKTGRDMILMTCDRFHLKYHYFHISNIAIILSAMESFGIQ